MNKVNPYEVIEGYRDRTIGSLDLVNGNARQSIVDNGKHSCPSPKKRKEKVMMSKKKRSNNNPKKPRDVYCYPVYVTDPLDIKGKEIYIDEKGNVISISTTISYNGKNSVIQFNSEMLKTKKARTIEGNSRKEIITNGKQSWPAPNKRKGHHTKHFHYK